MSNTKNKIKKALEKKIKMNETIPNEAIKGLVKESYQNYILNRNRLFGHRNANKLQFYGWFDCFYIEDPETGFNNYFEILKDGSIEDITIEVQKHFQECEETKEQALRS